MAIVIGLSLVYAGIFIWQSSFVIDRTRYFSLFDDPMTYSIGELQPDVVVEIWQGMNDEAALAGYRKIRVPALAQYLPEGRMYLPTDSPNILWNSMESYAYPPEIGN